MLFQGDLTGKIFFVTQSWWAAQYILVYQNILPIFISQMLACLKYLNWDADKTIDGGHTISTDCNYQLKNNTINDVIYYFFVQVFENRPIQRDMCLCHLNTAFFFQTNTLINLYMTATAQLENIQYYGVSLQNNYLAVPRPTLTLNDMLVKNLATKKILATSATVAFKLCSQLINTLTYAAKT